MPERVVITGASRGIGLELARQHAARGDSVLATCRRPRESAALAALAIAARKEIEVVPLDVTDDRTIAAAALTAEEAWGAVDVLWSNAAVYSGGSGLESDPSLVASLKREEGLSVFQTNTLGAILVAQAFLPLLRRGTRPRLAVLSSGYGSLALNRGFPYWYGASKAALNMLHRSLASDPAARGVTVLMLSPGWVRTDMGGPNASSSVEASVAGLLRVLDEARPEQNGAFLSWRGESVPF
ncbi:MAG TPA: SDR family oxidoreductase [Anaeromyxobacteraceae bacterium]|nr:SDR family oxidoreductase [Anaeromyxobacteraceae bacterium]